MPIRSVPWHDEGVSTGTRESNGARLASTDPKPCREDSIVGRTPPMTIPDLGQKLDPARVPAMSAQMGAILGYQVECAYTTAAVPEVTVDPRRTPRLTTSSHG
jgi:hypothetical protein